MQDLRLALRLLRRNPGFSVVDAVLLKQLPYHQPERIALIWEDATHQGFPLNNAAPANWIDWRKQNTVFSDIAAVRWSSLSLVGDGQPESILGNRVTPDFWRVMGAQAVLGRVFNEEEERRNAKVVVISHGLWQRRFGGDPKIAGRKVILSDVPYEIIGVMPPGFVFPNRRVELWTPSELDSGEPGPSRIALSHLHCAAEARGDDGTGAERDGRDHETAGGAVSRHEQADRDTVGAARPGDGGDGFAIRW
jgi:hypothetical protein